MKNNLILVVCLLVSLLMIVNITFAAEPDFRNVNWGMTIDEVKQKETLDLILEENGALMYKTSLAGMDCYLLYDFINQKLCSAMYSIDKEHINENQYIEDFLKLKNLLIRKYGPPDKDEEIWKRSLYKSDPNYQGFAVSIGDLILASTWETNKTKIDIVLWGNNYEIKHAIQYQSKEYEEKINEKNTQENLNKL